MVKTVLGVDISKAKFDVALCIKDRIKHKKFDNSPNGFSSLVDWLNSCEAKAPHICMEATGIYGEALATFLYDLGYPVSVVNPAQIKGFARSELTRTKTDKTDAKLIARFCRAMTPMLWHPQPLHIRQLQALVRRLEALQDMYQQESNRLEGATDIIQSSIQSMLKKLDKEIQAIKVKIKKHIDGNPDLRNKQKLLDTIPGIGEATISQILAFMPIEQFKNAKQLAAFVGLNPQHRVSGTSVNGRARLSKMGNSKLRKAFYMPAIVAKRHNPIIKAFSEKLKNAGKSNMVIIGAIMRKLVHIIYGVLKSAKAFDSQLAVI
jgi:transposase